MYMNQIAFEAHDSSHSFYQEQRRHHLSSFFTGRPSLEVKRWVEFKGAVRIHQKRCRHTRETC
jgi:hypothetical protein